LYETAADTGRVGDAPATKRSPHAPLLATGVAVLAWVLNCFFVYRRGLTCTQAESNGVVLGIAALTVFVAGAGEATLSARRTRSPWKATAWGLVGVLIQVPVVVVGFLVAGALNECVGN
jgi:hypothetical protein